MSPCLTRLCDKVWQNIRKHVKTHRLCNIITEVAPFSRSVFVQWLSPWKQIRSISPHPEDYMEEYLGKSIKENQRLMIENESQHLSILKMSVRDWDAFYIRNVSLMNSGMLMFHFIDFLYFRNSVSASEADRKKGEKDICGMKLSERLCDIWDNVIL